MAAEGDQIIIELKELDAFAEALSNGRFKRRLKLRGKEKKPSTSASPTRTPSAEVRSDTRTPERGSEAKAPKATRKTTDAGFTERGLESLDQFITRAHKRLGPYLPDWMFSRAMALILLIVLVVMVIFPALFLIIGGLTIALGAVAYSDPMIASRWLPGRTQPPQVLIAGVALLLLGVLVGIVRG